MLVAPFTKEIYSELLHKDMQASLEGVPHIFQPKG